MGQQFTQVWLWSEWPDRPQGLRDTGVDIVAQLDDGGICAVQCKFYESSASVDYNSISNFKTASNYINAKQRIFVSTSNNLTAAARRFLEDLNEPSKIILLSDLQQLPLNWMKIVSTHQPEVLTKRDIGIRVAIDISVPSHEIATHNRRQFTERRNHLVR